MEWTAAVAGMAPTYNILTLLLYGVVFYVLIQFLKKNI